MASALAVERWKWYRDGGVRFAVAMNAVMTNGTDDDTLPRIVAAASEAAMRNGMDNDAFLCVPATATEAAMTNGMDDDLCLASSSQTLRLR